MHWEGCQIPTHHTPHAHAPPHPRATTAVPSGTALTLFAARHAQDYGGGISPWTQGATPPPTPALPQTTFTTSLWTGQMEVGGGTCLPPPESAET